MKSLCLALGLLFMCLPVQVSADTNFDDFENDRSPLNGAGSDASWNPLSTPAFNVSLETAKVDSGAAALKVTWENKDLWPNFVIANLQREENCGDLFYEADAVRMAIAGPPVRIILKLVDADGFGTGDLAEETTSGSDTFEIYEFRYIDSAMSSAIDLENITEIQLLVDAGNQGTSGTVYMDTIELIRGSGTDAEIIGLVDDFDNDSSLDDDPNAPDSIPSGNSLISGPFITSVVDDPAGSSSAALKVDYNTSPWNVLWVEDMDITDWTDVEGISMDIYGSAGGIMVKLKDADGKESSDPMEGFVRHDGDTWDTFTWTFNPSWSIDFSRMGKLILFVEGPSGGQGTIYIDNVRLLGPITKVLRWKAY